MLQFFFFRFPFIFKCGGYLFSLIVMSFVLSVLCREPARPLASALSSAQRLPCHPPCARPSSARHLPVLCPLSALSPAWHLPILRPAPAHPLSGVCPFLHPVPACPPPGARPSSVRRPSVLSQASARSCPRTHSGTLGFPLAFPPPTVTMDNLEGFNSIFGSALRTVFGSVFGSKHSLCNSFHDGLLAASRSAHFAVRYAVQLSDSMPNHMAEGARRGGRRQRSWVPRSSRVPGGSTAVPASTQTRSRGGGARFPLYLRLLFPYCVIYLIGTGLDGGHRVRLNRKKQKCPTACRTASRHSSATHLPCRLEFLR